MGYTVRRARTSDVRAIARLVAGYADDRIVLGKETVTYYEDVQEFRVAEEDDGTVIGCGAFHVMWEDLAEVRTLAVDKTRHGFRPIEGTPVGPEVYAELLRSADEGVAEFLDLARVKPNTLGNTRMLRELQPEPQPQPQP